MSLSLDNLRDRLPQRLKDPLPGQEAQSTMAPQYEARQEALSVTGRDCREAGVLVLFLPLDDEPGLVLTVRRDHLPDHAGQISFPGGQREGDETLDETALREAHEEIALDPTTVRLLGALTPVYIPPSDFCVHPFIGVITHEPNLRPTDHEVGAVLRPTLRHLLHPETRVVETWTLHGTDVDVPYYDVDGHTVWGATAMMLAEVLSVVQDVTETA